MIQDIEKRIFELKKDTAANLLLIGDELRKAKEELPHGEFSQWVQDRAGFSLRTARNLMNAAQAFPPSKRQTLSDLSISKIYILSGLTEDERKALPAADMTTRELKRAAEELRQADDLEKFKILPDGFSQRAQQLINNCDDLQQLKNIIESCKELSQDLAETVALVEVQMGQLLKEGEPDA